VRIVALLLLLSARMVDAADWPGFRLTGPIVLQLDGAFASTRDLARVAGADAVEMRIGDRTRWFRTDRARTLGANAPLGRDLLAAVAPLHPNLRVLGSRSQLAPLADAADGVLVALEGVIDVGAGTYLLRRVSLAGP
jgi:hypothetical protein